jgi:hypothetical protein
MDLTITIAPDGAIRFLHDDRLRALFDEGATSLRRASHVEPTADARWTADLSPVGGPVLGPFETRCEALDAERGWLDDRLHLLP